MTRTSVFYKRMKCKAEVHDIADSLTEWIRRRVSLHVPMRETKRSFVSLTSDHVKDAGGCEY